MCNNFVLAAIMSAFSRYIRCTNCLVSKNYSHTPLFVREVAYGMVGVISCHIPKHHLTIKLKIMPTKIINAKKILEKKGIVQKQFDTSAFATVVEDFFMSHDESAQILLRPLRFVLLPEPPEGDFIDFLDVEKWDDLARDPNRSISFTDLLTMQKKGLLLPTLFINEPFIGNASAYLRDFCGFTVKSRTHDGRKMYSVTLPI